MVANFTYYCYWQVIIHMEIWSLINKRGFFPGMAVWMHHLNANEMLKGNNSIMHYIVLNKSWKQHLTKQSLYCYLPSSYIYIYKWSFFKIIYSYPMAISLSESHITNIFIIKEPLNRWRCTYLFLLFLKKKKKKKKKERKRSVFIDQLRCMYLHEKFCLNVILSDLYGLV